jgi:ribosomal protein L29
MCMLSFIRENINGILGTVIFHLIIVVMIMLTRLSSVTRDPEHSMLIDFETNISEELFRELTESLMDRSFENPESGQVRRNIAVNISEERPVSDEFRDMSQEQLSELEKRVEEILNNAANGNMPVSEQREIDIQAPPEVIQQDETKDEPYSGPTTITYNLPGRTHLRMPVPVYKCPDGGIVEVMIAVNQQGRVIRADVQSNPSNFNERCIIEMGIEAAMGSRFNEKTDAPPVQSGTITFYFQKQ